MGYQGHTTITGVGFVLYCWTKCWKKIVKVLTTDTFSVIIADDRVKSLTYNEWESYRVGQAYAGIENLLSNQSEKIKVLFKQFTQDMQDKYAGQASWVKIYNNLIENIKEG